MSLRLRFDVYMCYCMCGGVNDVCALRWVSRSLGAIRVYVVECVLCRLEWPDGLTCLVVGSCGNFLIGVSV